MVDKRIVHFTDIHIEEGEFFDLSGLRLRPFERFKVALEFAKPKSDDLIVISGDLAAWDPSEKIYAKIKSLLDHYDCDKLIFAGNHDCSVMIHQYFGTPLINQKNDGIYQWDEWKIFYLDSSDYFINNEQLIWLSENWINKKSLFFIHHPPLKMKSDWMDKKYPLRDRERVWNIIEDKKITPIFCGHYHNFDSRKKNGIDVYLTKSTLYQIVEVNGERKELDEIAYREIFLSPIGDVTSEERVVPNEYHSHLTI